MSLVACDPRSDSHNVTSTGGKRGKTGWLQVLQRIAIPARSAPVSIRLCSWLWFSSWHVFSEPGQRVKSSTVSWSLWPINLALCFLVLPIFFPYTLWPFLAFRLLTSFSIPVRVFPFRFPGTKDRMFIFSNTPSSLRIHSSCSFLPTTNSADVCWTNIHFVTRMMSVCQLSSSHCGCALLIILVC